MLYRTCLVPLLLAAPLRGGEDLSVLNHAGKEPPRAMLRAYLLTEAQKHFDTRRALVAKLKTPEEVRKRQEALRARFALALGGFPARTPLNARVAGKLDGEGYTVEKVIYESRPDHHVTANLYLPRGKGPFPGVLMPIGHSANGKAADYVQRGAILLARHGLAVLAYDPIGQGERRQLLEGGKPALASSTSEHTMLGVGALLVGRNTASYRVWDGLRSLDYLAGRPEVDPKRLGCTGCSGGGTLTSYLMALDDRILAGAPSCYITSLERLFATIGPQDAEQNITGQVAFGMEHADYLTMRAPRPALVCAATRDFFDVQGTWTSFREAKRLYGLLGHPERIDLVESDSGHGFPRPQREAVLRFMRRWLLHKDDAPAEEDFPVRKDAELLCTRTGQVLEDLGGVSAFQLNARRSRELAAARARETAGRSPAGLVKEAARRLRLALPVRAASVREEGAAIAREGYRIRKLVYQTEPGILVPALLFVRAGGERDPLVLYAHGGGKAADAGPGGPIEKRVLGGRRVLALDLRGMGETAPAEKATGAAALFGPDVREAFLALHLDRPLLGQRVHDLLAVLAKEAEAGGDGAEVVGVGQGGLAALHAAALDRRVARLSLGRSLVSWSAVAEAPVSAGQLAWVVPGVLSAYDLPDLAAALAPRPLTIRGPVDGRSRPVAAEDLEGAYKAARRAYEREKARGLLVIEAGKE
jgi:cephalosporin-C deacetylase-like acetyl esterase